MNQHVTLSYDWQYGQEEVVIEVGSYCEGNCLYIGLHFMENGELQLLDDLTVNLTEYPLEINEAYIDGHNSGNKLKFIERHKLGKVLPEKGASGSSPCWKVAFDLKLLAELDPVGMEEYLLLHGIEMPEKKESREKKAKQHGRER